MLVFEVREVKVGIKYDKNKDMKFLKKTDEYVKMYSKKKAAEMLLEDDRVKSVKCTFDEMIVITKPIVPVAKRFRNPDKPIGTYIIKIKNNKKSIECRVKRLEGTVDEPRDDSNHIHICDNFVTYTDGSFSDKICWGSIYEEIVEIKRNKDWFWFVKRILDLLCDFHRDLENAESVSEYDKICRTFIESYQEFHSEKIVEKMKQKKTLKAKIKPIIYRGVLVVNEPLAIHKDMLGGRRK